MVRKSETERLQELDIKIQQLKAQKQKLEAQAKQKERKDRTRRLIRIGAIFESWWGVHTPEEAEAAISLLKEKGVQPDAMKQLLAKKRSESSFQE